MGMQCSISTPKAPNTRVKNFNFAQNSHGKHGRGSLLASTMVIAKNKQLHRFLVQKSGFSCKAQNLEIQILAKKSHGKKWAWPIISLHDGYSQK